MCLMPGRPKSTSGRHRFGGDWTEHKLQVLSDYLAAYVKALKNQRFEIEYIDAFAGTGYRTERESAEPGALPLFPDLAADEAQGLLKGSAVRALEVVPPFHSYVFVERSRDRVASLEALRAQYPEREILVRQGEANQVVRELCERGGWNRRRSVLFLDPYGMQVEWDTIEAVARTKAIDMWILFPLGIGVNRLVTQSGRIPGEWRRRLDVFLGTPSWYDHFYQTKPQPTLFGDENHVVKASQEVIGAFFVERLKTIFAGVAEKPLILTNAANCPLYLFCFAAANPAGAALALRIANHLLRMR